jgi:hypothetical protein
LIVDFWLHCACVNVLVAMSSGDDIVADNGLFPLVALLTSDAVEAAAQKNNLAFADLLAPFCATSISIKDPTGVQISTKLRIDLRDVQKKRIPFELNGFAFGSP